MESMQVVRGQVSNIVDVDFFLSETALQQKYEDDKIAQIIKGAVYDRTRRRINDFVSRCEQTLAGLQQRVDQTQTEFQSLVSQANAARPGSGPSDLFVDRHNPNSVARYNEKVERHNHQIDLHRRLTDQASRAKERHEDAVAKFNEKKAELEEQIRERLEELKPALDQDILTLLGKMQQLAYDNIRNKHNLFAGFLLTYLAKKAYIFLYDRIEDTTEQRAATDIFKKLNDELDVILSSDGITVQQGLHQTASFLSTCYQTNAGIYKGIQEKLKELPYQDCKKVAAKVYNLLAPSIETAFAYKHIIDPSELAKVEQQVRDRKTIFERHIQSLDEFASIFNPTFAAIAGIRDFAQSELQKMDATKSVRYDPVARDTVFALGVFDDHEQERYMKKHKPWLCETQKDIQNALQIDVIELVKTVAQTELLTKTAKQTLASDEALVFHANQEKLSRKKQQFQDAIKTLDGILNEINELPRQKSAEFGKKISSWLYLSLLPGLNIGMAFAIMGKIKEYLPAFRSHNSAYVELKLAQITKYQTYCYIHIALMLVTGVVAFFVDPQVRPFLLALAGTYAVPAAVLYTKARQLKGL